MNSLAFAICWCVVQVTAVSLLSAGVYLPLKRFAPRTRGLVPLTSLISVVLLTALLLSPWPRWSGTNYLGSQLSSISSQLSAFSVHQEESLPAVVQVDNVDAQHPVNNARATEGRPEVAAASDAVTTHNQNDPESVEHSLAANDPTNVDNSRSAEEQSSNEDLSASSALSTLEESSIAFANSSLPSPPRGRGAGDEGVVSQDAEHSDFNIEETSVGVLTSPARLEDVPARWPLVVFVLFGISLSIGLVRLLIGLAFVRAQRRSAQPIEEPILLDLVDILCDQVGGTRWVDVRESSQLFTAATIGWRRPIILLPADWRNWSDDERRAVLAHEIAHIKHRDFPAWLAAQFGLSLHFYHPLVHWLVSRLRLEQELAADALAAPLAGGHALYLKTLAAMTLRQVDRPAYWPARAFLPTRGTLLRRIEMLKHARELPSIVSRPVRIAVIALVLCAGVAAAGLRPGTDQLSAVSDQPDADVSTSSSGPDTAALPKPMASPLDRRQFVGLQDATRSASGAAFVENDDAMASGGRQSPVEEADDAFAEAPAEPKGDDAGRNEAGAESRPGNERQQAIEELSVIVDDSKTLLVSGPNIYDFKPTTPEDEQYLKQTRENFEKIAAALRKYRAVHGQLPPPVVSRGRQAHSWRVAILPFFEGTDGLELYEQYKFDEPWDGPNNKKLLDKMPAVYRSPLDNSGSNTATYFAITGPLFDQAAANRSGNAAFADAMRRSYWGYRGTDSTEKRNRAEDDDDKEKRGAAGWWYGGTGTDSKDEDHGQADGQERYYPLVGPATLKKVGKASSAGPSLVIIEAKRSTPWSKPNEVYFDPEGPIEQLKGYHEQVLPMLTGEGTIRFLPRDADRAKIVQALKSTNDPVYYLDVEKLDSDSDRGGSENLRRKSRNRDDDDDRSDPQQPNADNGAAKVEPVTDATFAAEVEKSPVPVLLHLWATWNGPDRTIAPILDEVASEMGNRVRFRKIDIDENRKTASKFHVTVIPTLLILNRGQETGRLIGVQSKDAITRAIEQALQSPANAASGPQPHQVDGTTVAPPPKGETPEGSAKVAPEQTNSKVATGTFQGRVVFEGTPPVLPPLFKAGDKNVRNSAVVAVGDMPDERLIVGPTKGVANVFVYLAATPVGALLKKPGEPGDLNIAMGRFFPHAVLQRTGQATTVRNFDPIAENIHTFPRRNAPFNMVLPPNFKKARSKDDDGIILEYKRAESEPIEVKSDLHPWMIAYHLPLDHPFAAITNLDGKFEIESLPPGVHKFQIWHEACDGKFLAKDLAVEIEAGEKTQLDIPYPEKKLVLADSGSERTGKVMIGRGVRSDAGVEGTIVLNPDKTLSQAKPVADEETPEQHRSKVNLKRLGLAMHNYHDVNGRYPPAVVIGPDGKTPRSWRVELLPYIERMDGNKLGTGTYKDVYDAYKFDEPWDGPNNKKLLEKMPDVFRALGDDEKSTNTSYFAVASRYWEDLVRDRDDEVEPNTTGTVFDGLRGIHLRDVRDGTSNTIMLVESKLFRQIAIPVPWTQPDDIVYDAEKPVPVLGSIHKDGYFAGFADGSVHWIPSKTDEKTQRAMFTRAGGEAVKRPE